MDLRNIKLQRSSVTVYVPATSANIGPAFDSIGIALDIWNKLIVNVRSSYEDEPSLVIEGEGSDCLPRDDTNLVVVGMKAAFLIGSHLKSSPNSLNKVFKDLYDGKYTDIILPPLNFTCINTIPNERGIGSSSAALVSGLLAGLALLGVKIPTQEEVLLNVVSIIEGHPDNAAPTLYGGVQIGVKYLPSKYHVSVESSIETIASLTDEQHTDLSNYNKPSNDNVPSTCTPCPRWISNRVDFPQKLQCIFFIPDKKSETAIARAILSHSVTREDAIFNCSRVALLVNALSTGAFHLLKIAMDDRLHQPQRASHSAEHLYPLIDAAIHAGAYGACLSGAGPSVLAFIANDVSIQKQDESQDSTVGKAMLNAAKRFGVSGRIITTTPSQKGAYVTFDNAA